MKVSYDPKADAMYIYLGSKKKGITKTEELGGFIVDYSGKKLAGVEILNASKVFGPKLKLNSTPKSHQYQSTAIPHKIR